MVTIWRHIPEAGLVALALVLPWMFLLRPARGRSWTPPRLVAAILSTLILIGTGFLLSPNFTRSLPPAFSQWARAFGLTWAAVIVWITAVRQCSLFIHSRAGAEMALANPARRRFLQAAVVAAYVAPAAVACAALIERNDLRIVEVDIHFPGLPQDLDGIRLVQLSDIHLGEFVSRKDLARAIDAANSMRPHIALVTGDLVSYDGDPLEECIAELTRLRSDAGTFGCLGNHEIYAHAEDKVTLGGARAGMRFLRGQAHAFRFGTAKLNLAGVDYQPFRAPYLTGAESLVAPGALNILLSHNPDVFPVARHKGFPLTISGHTHGGQVNVEILSNKINPARFFTPYTSGLYREQNAAVFVTRGIGTIGVPVRLGAPPEVTLIRLRTV